MPNNAPFLELRGIKKSFGSILANQDVNVSIRKGTIHAIVGENGAGKSTAMKVLFGQYSPDSGEILLDGKACHWKSSADAMAAGIGMVHQHFMLAETHSALENILLGTHSFPWSSLGKNAAKERLKSLMTSFGMEVDLDAAVEDLSVGIHQRIEILKLLFRDSNVFILDEPTAVLAPSEIETFFRLLREMTKQGKTIIIITHKLREVLDLAETVTVFRAGKVVAEKKVSETNMKDLASLMVGEEIQFTAVAKKNSPGKVLLEAKSIGLKNKKTRLQEANFTLREGEVLGIAGVEGNGQSELIHALASPREQIGVGALLWQGKEITSYSAAQMRELGMGLFAEDRLKEALLLEKSASENFLLAWRRLKEFRNGPFLRRMALRQSAFAEMKKFAVRPLDINTVVKGMSGGNQQKLVVARELYGAPKFLLAAQPTRGVDIGAVQFIHQKILEAKNKGAGVMVISSELEELLKLSDRILVLYRGRFVAEFAASDFDEKKIGYFMIGGAP